MTQARATTEPMDTQTTIRQLMIIWAALTASLLMYVAMGYFLQTALTPADLPPDQADLLRTVLGVVALLNVVAAFVIRRLLLSPERPIKATPDTVVVKALTAYRNGVIVSLALSESTALLGLVLYMLFGHMEDLLAFTGLAFVGMVFFRPSSDAAEDYLAAQKKHVL